MLYQTTIAPVLGARIGRILKRTRPVQDIALALLVTVGLLVAFSGEETDGHSTKIRPMRTITAEAEEHPDMILPPQMHYTQYYAEYYNSYYKHRENRYPLFDYGLRINRAGLELIKHFEGFHPTPYRDPVGYWTVGYGHLIKKSESFGRLTEAEAEALLIEDLREVEAMINHYVKVPLNDNQYASLVSLVFNIGAGNFAKSTLLRKLNEGDYAAVPREMKRWARAKNQKLKGLQRRRLAEGELFASL